MYVFIGSVEGDFLGGLVQDVVWQVDLFDVVFAGGVERMVGFVEVGHAYLCVFCLVFWSTKNAERRLEYFIEIKAPISIVEIMDILFSNLNIWNFLWKVSDNERLNNLSWLIKPNKKK